MVESALFFHCATTATLSDARNKMNSSASNRKEEEYKNSHAINELLKMLYTAFGVCVCLRYAHAKSEWMN